MSTLLGDLDTVIDYLSRHNAPQYMDAVVARLREAEKRLREEMKAAEQLLVEAIAAGKAADHNVWYIALKTLKDVNGGPP